MDIQPVKRYSAPTYPTRDGMDANPELLRAMPRRWVGNTAVLTLLAGLGMMSLSGGISAADKTTESPVVARVAPLFPQQPRQPISLEAGGIAGGIGITNFLSEDEARRIIVDEVQKAGIAFTADVQAINNIPMPAYQEVQGGNPIPSVAKLSVTLDGTDTRKHIGYEFVSSTDITEWQQKGIPADAMFGEEAAAQSLHDGITQGIPAGTYAIFYDPMQGTEEQSREQLRQQVRDFITWLKTQGVI